MQNPNLVDAGKNLTTAVVLLIIGALCQAGAFSMPDDQTMFSSLVFVGFFFQVAAVAFLLFCGRSLIKAGQ